MVGWILSFFATPKKSLIIAGLATGLGYLGYVGFDSMLGWDVFGGVVERLDFYFTKMFDELIGCHFEGKEGNCKGIKKL